MTKAVLALLVICATLTMACDAAGSVVVDNKTDVNYVAYVSRHNDRDEWYQLPAGTRVRVAANAVGAMAPTDHVQIMDSACAVMFDQSFMNAEFPGGGTIIIHAHGDVSFEAGNPEIPEAASTTDQCAVRASPTP